MTDYIIAVAIITRNRAQFLSKVLQSLIIQTRVPDRVYVIDNASSDNTKQVVEQISQKLSIKYIYEERIGLPFARNAALSNTEGDILAFVDDDAIAQKDWLAEIEKTFHQDSQAVAVQGITKNIYPKSTIATLLQYICQDIPKLRDRDGCIVKAPAMVCTMNFAFLIKPIKDAHIRFDPFLMRGEDRGFGYQLLLHKFKIIYQENVVVYHHWPRSLNSFIRMRWKAGIARALLKEKLHSTGYHNETHIWNLVENVKNALKAMNTLSPFQRALSLPLLLLGKIITQISQYYATQKLKRDLKCTRKNSTTNDPSGP